MLSSESQSTKREKAGRETEAMLYDAVGAHQHLSDDRERCLLHRSLRAGLVRTVSGDVDHAAATRLSAGDSRALRMLPTHTSFASAVLRKPVLYLSHYFKRHRQEY